MKHIIKFFFLVLIFNSSLVYSQNWPTKPVKIIAPSTPGGPPDVYARALADIFTKTLGQPFIVDNMPAAGGMIAAQSILKATNDGYALLVNTAGMMTITPSANISAKYFPADFTQICQGVSASLVLAVHPILNIKNFAELVKWLKDQKVRPTYSSYSIGSPAHLLGYELSQLLGVEMIHVPYKSTPQQLTDMLSAVSPLGFVQIATASPSIKAGKIIPLATTSESRSIDFPNVPSISEVGYPQLVTTVWFGLSGPKNLSPLITKKLIDLHQQMTNSSEFESRMLNSGMVVTKNICGDIFTSKMQRELDNWSKVIGAAGFVADN
jgi:tripartite-type tricarboxylate transporter receptor subunit TctC